MRNNTFITKQNGSVAGDESPSNKQANFGERTKERKKVGEVYVEFIEKEKGLLEEQNF